MFRLTNLKLRTRLIALVAAAVAGPLILGTIAFFPSNHAENEVPAPKPVSPVSSITADPAKRMLQVGNLLSSISDDHAKAQSHIAQLHELRSQFEADHEACLNEMPEGALKDAISAEYDAGIKVFNVVEQEYLPLVRKRELTKARQFHQARLTRLFAEHAKAAAEVARLADELSRSTEPKAPEPAASPFPGWLGFGLAGVILALGIRTTRRILKPLQKAVTVAHGLAAGDLTQRLEIDSNDELGEMARSLNYAVEGMHATVAAIEEHSYHIAGAADEISSVASESANDGQRQNDFAGKAGKSLQQISSSIAEATAHSGHATDSALKTAQVAKQGGEIVNEVLTTMRSIAESVRASAQKMDELGKSSRQIGKFVDVIDKIADQTNLLALNAAIEAARAGEHGRGFAVVADEVRKLSDRTAKATKEIAQMVENVQQEASAAITGMQAGNQEVDTALTTAAKAGDTLEEIIAAAQQVVDTISNVSAATSRQSIAVNDIGSTLEEIARLSHGTATAAQQSADLGKDLSSVACDLQEMLAGFRLNGDANTAVEWQHPQLPQYSASASLPGYTVSAENTDKVASRANTARVEQTLGHELEAEPASLYEAHHDAPEITSWDEAAEQQATEEVAVVVPIGDETHPDSQAPAAPDVHKDGYDQAIA